LCIATELNVGARSTSTGLWVQIDMWIVIVLFKKYTSLSGVDLFRPNQDNIELVNNEFSCLQMGLKFKCTGRLR
jgi:hypothetical protein